MMVTSSLVAVLGLALICTTGAFLPHTLPTRQQQQQQHATSGILVPKMAVVPPSGESTVGVIGAGFVSVIIAKLSALAGYQTWIVCPPGEEENTLSLLDENGGGENNNIPPNLELVSGADSEGIESKMRETDALMVAVDKDTTMSENVLQYLITPERALKLKRVVAMSRNLNGKGLGFFVKASKISANSEVWDGGSIKEYQQFEKVVKEQVAAMGRDDVEYTFARAGTLKGGACGEQEYNQYLSSNFYNLVQKDIVNWQLLFDCQIRGVKLAKGDVLEGPGNKAVFVATGSDEAVGDTGRCGIAEAMVRSLAFEGCGNMDFGVGTKESRVPPSDEEWKTLFESIA